MRAVLAIFVLAWTLAAAGCSGSKYYQSGVRATDLSAVRPGASRQAIEELLGQPVSTEQRGGRRVDTYEYDMGSAADPYRAGPLLGGDIALCLPCVLVYGTVEIIHQSYLSSSAKKDFQQQRGRLKVIFGENDTAIDLEIPEPEPHDGPLQPGRTTRDEVVSLVGRGPDLAFREDQILVYRLKRKSYLIFEFDGDILATFATTNACTISGICVFRTADRSVPPKALAPPWEDEIAKNFAASPGSGCAVYAYSDARIYANLDVNMTTNLVGRMAFALDHQLAGDLFPRGYLWWRISPGAHVLEILGPALDDKKHSPKAQIDCQPGETYFIRVRARAVGSFNRTLGVVKKYLEFSKEKRGRKRIASRRLLMNNFPFPQAVETPALGS